MLNCIAHAVSFFSSAVGSKLLLSGLPFMMIQLASFATPDG